MFMAEVWLEEAPAAVHRLLISHQDLGPMQLERVHAELECKVRFNPFGRPRQDNLGLVVSYAGGPIPVTIEDKTDVTFDRCNGDMLANAVDRELVSTSNGVRRDDKFATCIRPLPGGHRL